MENRGKPVADRTFAWWQNSFELEGIVGFLAGWLLGILLGMIWGPLFWLGFLPGIVVLFATRSARRVTPSTPSMVIAPCDGVVVSVEDGVPPEELRLSGDYKRIRISSSPFATNNIHAPIAGSIDHLIREDGAPETVAAMRPDSSGLAQMFMTVVGEADSVGLRIATGGLGPRLEPRTDAGDRAAAGKTIATRRLGGWCDVYVPTAGQALVEPGRTLIGGESGLWVLGEKDGPRAVPDEVETETVADAPPNPETVPPEVAEEAEEEADTRSNDPAEMFARLRREARKMSDDPDPDESDSDDPGKA
ncbi:phosphatidylserine decarboxylase [Henriciella aquimarina]|uniref:phosphatidylserine decarboxylase n=1 Tax=Henriciella aquimarina TaxID=545261 RepID=UPI0009FE7037|nr:phosphatidylserine decarboxylase [Henriciella aquimarina]